MFTLVFEISSCVCSMPVFNGCTFQVPSSFFRFDPEDMGPNEEPVVKYWPSDREIEENRKREVEELLRVLPVFQFLGRQRRMKEEYVYIYTIPCRRKNAF